MPSASFRPEMPTAEATRLSNYLIMRRRVLLDEAEEDFARFMELIGGADQARLWGIPDSTLSPLGIQTRQLVTPGLYGRKPAFTTPPGDEELATYLDRARFWQHAQVLQFFVVGIGIYWRKLRVTTELVGELRASLVDELVDGADVYPIFDADNPSRLVGLWHLRIRDGRFAWDVWQIQPDGTGSYMVREARQDGTAGADWSARYLIARDGSRGPLVGPDFPAIDPDGRAFLPWIPYVPEDAGNGCLVPEHYRRTTYRGSFRSCSLWTFTNRAALFGTGEHTYIAGPDLDSIPGVKVQTEEGNDSDAMVGSALSPLWTQRVQPGTVTFLPSDKPLSSVSIGPGLNLPNLLAFASAYSMLLAVGDGLHPTDATRQSANPSSGMALQIENASKREFSAQVEPLFYASDRMSIQYSIWLLRMVGIEFTPDIEQYGLKYHTIPLSPNEQKDLRDDTEWQVNQGLLSQVDAWLRVNGSNRPREEAIRAIVQAAVDKAMIQQLVDEKLTALGVSKSGTPPTPPGGATSDAGPVVAEGNPYRVEQRGSEFVVVKIADGKVMGTFPTREKAMAQFKALEAAAQGETHP